MSTGKRMLCRLSRREFLWAGSVSLGAGAALAGPFGPTSSLFAATTFLQSKFRPESLVIILELSGGNDGLNTVIPRRNDTYYRLRPTLAIPDRSLLKLNDEVGLHPALTGMKKLWDEGELAIIQGCGSPNLSHNHYTARNCWHTAAPDGSDSQDWLVRFANLTNEPQPDQTSDDDANEDSVLVSDTLARTGSAVYQAGNRSNSLAVELQGIAKLIQAGSPARTFRLRLDGFDTHGRQKARHHALLSYFDKTVHAFFRELDRSGRGSNVVMMVFSEFGRKARENAGFGTDHGAAGPMFLIGRRVRAGLYGEYPSLVDLDELGDLRTTVDFRQVYATVLSEWMGCDQTHLVLGGSFPTLGIFA